MNDLRGMVAHVGDLSNLILDPNLDSYYLMDVTLVTLPQTMDRMNQIANKYIFKDPASLTSKDRMEMIADAALLNEADLTRASGDMDTAFNENPNFGTISPSLKGNLEAPLATYKDASTKLVDLLKKVGNGEAALDRHELVTVANEARTASYTFWQKAVVELDLLLQKRIDGVQLDIWKSMAICFSAMALALICFAFVARSITKPLGDIKDSMLALTKDNHTNIPCTSLQDELGDMARALEVFKQNALHMDVMREEQRQAESRELETRERQSREKIEADKRAIESKLKADAEADAQRKQTLHKMANDFESSVGGIVQGVASAATELRSSAEGLNQIAANTSSDASSVASATDQANASVQVVASSAEQLTGAISEISRRINETTHYTADAVEKSHATNTTVAGLAHAAEKIGNVVKLIQDIAGQTNLLALNATIEAARAGDAGRGFAVVASEVKNLANQTEKATGDISEQISSIQQVSHSAATAIQEIGGIIEKINEITTGLAAAVEEQSAATQEIARNTEQASAGTRDVAKNILRVTEGAQEAGDASREVLAASDELSKQAETLREHVGHFLSTIRAA